MGFKEYLKKAKEDKLNAFIYLDEDAEKKVQSKNKSGKLSGKVIAVKSCINVKGLLITCASKTLENYKGTYDADVIRKIRSEGGIILGMTNMDEFASGASGETSAYGPTVNPSAPGFIPGGSSSGSAAAVAAGLCDFSLGTDTGGSIRNPASHCGVVGIKPSYGRVSRYGLVDLSMSLDQIGPFARTVDDAKLLFDIIKGASPNDPSTKIESEIKKVSVPKKIRVGMITEFEGICDKEIYSLIRKKANLFGEIIPISLKHIKLAVQTYYPLVYVEFFSGTRKFDGRRFGKKIEDSAGEEVLRRILGGKEISRAEYGGQYYRKALAAKKIIAKELLSTFEKVDVIIAPVTPRLPHKIGEEISPKDMYAYDAFTIPANLAGICAGVLPAGKISGVSVGVQVMAAPFNEETMFAVMKKIEDSN